MLLIGYLKSRSHDGTSSWDAWVLGFELLLHELGDNMKATVSFKVLP